MRRDFAREALADSDGTRNNIGVKIKVRSQSPLKKKARRGFRGYPIASVAFYGPDDTRASKVAVSIVPFEGAAPRAMKRFFSEESDVRRDLAISEEILRYVEEQGAKSVAMPNAIIGCPHEEGIDYPDGEACPECPFWGDRDRWAGVGLV